eukprot:814422-Pleurochrysis_carterae.AAC.3
MLTLGVNSRVAARARANRVRVCVRARVYACACLCKQSENCGRLRCLVGHRYFNSNRRGAQ